MIDINVNNETGRLNTVLIGIADDFGGTPSIEECYDPKAIEHVLAGTFPLQEEIILEMNNLVSIFNKYNIDVLRPSNIKGVNQIFARDIAFVIDNKIVISNVIKNRAREIEAIRFMLDKISAKDILKMPEEARGEGGDVILYEEFIFLGYSSEEDFNENLVARTNYKALDFIAKNFPRKKVVGFELNKSDNNPKENALHLDCCFQPIGKNMAILYEGGFKNKKDVNFLYDLFGSQNIIKISKEEMYNMNSNIFSLSENVIISEVGFNRLNTELRRRGFTIEETAFSEIAKMEGLFRCSTMPLNRQ